MKKLISPAIKYIPGTKKIYKPNNTNMKTRETRIFILFLSAIIIVFGIYTVLVLQTAKIINYYTDKQIDLPEEIELAQPGDLLQVEKVTKDSIYLGFKK